MNDNQEKLNVQLFNVVKNDKDSEAKLKKVKYLIRLGADVNAKFFGKSILSQAVIDGNIEPSIIAFLKEKGGEEWEISREEAYVLALRFWDKNGKIKSVEEIKSLVRCGANLGEPNKNTNNQIWKYLSLEEMNEILKILPKGYEIDGRVNLTWRELKELPDFSKVKVRGEFDCSHNRLISLEGAPSEVGGGFDCSNNKLTSLQGGPKKVGGTFRCFKNQLTTLEGAPKKVGYGFDCSDNQLTNLIGALQKVGGWFCCSSNQLTSLEGAPQKVKGDFICESNQFVSLKGMPKKIGGSLVIEEEVLAKLEEKKGVLSGIFKNIFFKDGR